MSEVMIKGFSIQEIEQKMMSLPQVEAEVMHKFETGKYIRELHIKQGTLIIGLHHNYIHKNNFIKGKLLILIDGQQKEITAPMSFESAPGRKIAYALEDTIWQNEYDTDIQDIELLEAMYFTKQDNLLEYQAHHFAMEGVRTETDRIDYKKCLIDLDITQDRVNELCHNEADMRPLPHGEYKVRIALSPIEGLGILATTTIHAGETIGPARIGSYRTPLGRYTNHAQFPNCEMINRDNDLYLVATKEIKGMVGGLPGEECTTDYRRTRRTIELGLK